MCGINGFIKKCDNPEQILSNMNNAIIHRGPDDQGYTTSNSVCNKTLGLGHVRLSIIDLSDAGYQPMYYNKRVGAFSNKYNSNLLEDYGDVSIQIVFNGEIYNYSALKELLIKKGYKFSSKTDTEVVLASYLEWGNECVNKFEGMRSFAIYNPISLQIFCSRDRLGKKPFFYYFDGENFIFSSEIKGILEHKDLNINTKKNIDQEAIDFYFTMQFIPAPRSIYKNIKKLEARHNLIINIGYSEILSLENYCYYKIPKYRPIKNKKLLIKEGEILIDKTVKERMFSSDVPVGANLSGGLDSSTVVAKMIKYIDNNNLHTFSIGFEGKYDESKYIHLVEKAFGTKHHHEYFNENIFEKMLDDTYFYYDEPFGDDSIFPTRYVSKLAEKNVKVVLTGDGGDEIFGGYELHEIGFKLFLLLKIPKGLRKILSKIIPNISKFNLNLIKKAFMVSLGNKNDFFSNVLSLNSYVPEIYKKWTKEKMSEILELDNGNIAQSLIDFDLFYGTLPDHFLQKTDRASMSNSIEYRSPFCDIKRIEWARRVPINFKISLRDNKIIMKDMIKELVPNQILNRSKQGFVPPIQEWLKNDKYIELIKKELNSDIGISIGKNWNKILKDSLKKGNTTFLKLFLFYIYRYKEWINQHQ